MRCFKCGSTLGKRDYCQNCGQDVKAYKKICRTSGAYYNAGLNKAKVRDLTGAAVMLRRSLELDKTNIPARNLLGLVFFEMGEAAYAIREWIISSNMQKEDNDATRYLMILQKNQNRLDEIASCIKKYNICLKYIAEDGVDLAVIQLKKVILQYPKMVRAYQLLGLLYLKQKQYKKAAAVLKKCLKIDRGNTTARRYMEELRRLSGRSLRKDEKESGKNAAILKAVSSGAESEDEENEGVIVPVYTKSFESYWVTAAEILLGVVIGAMILFFVIFPTYKNKVLSDHQKELSRYQTSVSEDRSMIAELKNTGDELTRERNELKTRVASLEEELKQKQEPEGTEETISPRLIRQYDAEIALLDLYLQQKGWESAFATDASLNEKILDQTKLLDESEMASDNLKDTLDLLRKLYSDKADSLYQEGFTTYQSGDRHMEEDKGDIALGEYQQGAEYLSAVVLLKPEKEQASLWLAVCYHHLNQGNLAANYYQYYLDHFRGHDIALDEIAERMLKDLSGESEPIEEIGEEPENKPDENAEAPAENPEAPAQP